MRKSISIYNHKKFAQKVEDVNADYINKLLAKPGDVTQEFVYYIVRVYFDDESIFKTIKDNNLNYDKTIYTDRSSAGYINKIDQIAKDPRITNKTRYKEVSTKAVEFIKNKLKQNQGTSAPAADAQQPAGPPMAGSGAGTAVTPSAQAPVLSPNQVAQQPQVTPEQADVYLSYIIPILENFSKDQTKPKIFTQRYSSEINEITNGLGILRNGNDPKYFKKLEDFNKRIGDLSILFNKLMYPTGTTQAGNTTFVNDWYTFGNQIINEIQAGLTTESKEKVQKDIGIFQTEFLNKNPGNTDISGVANKVNQAIDKFNIGKGKEKLTRLR